MSLVKGFTDILTPINRWVDSAFTRGGGLDSTLSFDLVGSADSQAPKISETLELRTYNCNCSATVTRSTNLITVSFTITEMGSQGTTAYVGLVPNNNARSDTRADLLTSGAELVSWTDPLGLARATSMSYGTTTILYRTEAPSPGDVFLSVTKAVSNSEWTYRRVIGALVPEGSRYIGRTITFAIKNPFIYEGAFINPPYKESLDCSPSNPFFLNSFYKNYYSYYARQYITTSGWKRMFLLPNLFHGTRLAFYGKIMILKEYIHNLQECYIVDFSIYDVPTQSAKGYSIEPLFYGSRDTAGEYITKFRFAKDPSTSRIYLEYYYKNTNSNAIRIYIKDFMYETTTLADSLGSYPNTDVLNAVFKKGLISDQTTVTNDVLIGSEVSTIVKTTYFNEPS